MEMLIISGAEFVGIILAWLLLLHPTLGPGLSRLRSICPCSARRLPIRMPRLVWCQKTESESVVLPRPHQDAAAALSGLSPLQRCADESPGFGEFQTFSEFFLGSRQTMYHRGLRDALFVPGADYGAFYVADPAAYALKAGLSSADRSL